MHPPTQPRQGYSPAMADSTTKRPPITIRPAGTADLRTVARVRARCYRGSYSFEEKMLEASQFDRANLDRGDVLLADRDGELVATTTSLSGLLNVRGAMLPCQGIAWVGTTHNARRAGGLASGVMRFALNLARDRGQALSALVPFRASYYEHFGYGSIERQVNWTLPLGILPQDKAATEGWRFIEPDDDDALRQVGELRRHQAMTFHGDMVFDQFEHRLGFFGTWLDGFAERGYLFGRYDHGKLVSAIGTYPAEANGIKTLQLAMPIYRDWAELRRQLAFVGTMKDQYASVELRMPADAPLALMLGETQVPHRPVVHSTASAGLTNRLQVRVLDHVRVLSDMAWPDANASGSCVVAIDEPEETTTKLKLTVAGGNCEATSSAAAADFHCPAKVWSSVLFGELRATDAVSMGLACGERTSLLDTLTHGPSAFCREQF